MSIRFLRPWNGYDDGDKATLSQNEEARLVGLGVATYALYGGKSLAGKVPSYLGQVANNVGQLNEYYATYIVCMSRSAHIASEHLSNIKLILPNWGTKSAGGFPETNADVAATIEASIEYPAGIYTRVTFNRENIGSANPGENFESDFVGIYIPRGEMFWIRNYYSAPGASGIFLTNAQPLMSIAPALEGANFSATSTPNLVMATGAGQRGDGFPSATTHYIAPLAILQETTNPSVFIHGDSISVGQADTCDQTLSTGIAERAVFPLACITMSRGGIRAANSTAAYAVNWKKQFSLAKYCSHVLVLLGSNDCVDGTAAATIAGYLAQIKKDWFSDKIFIIGTIMPRADATNTTPMANEAIRQALNLIIRNNGVTGAVGYLDFDAAATAAYQEGVFKSASFTSDGVHPLQVGNSYIAANTKVDLLK